MCGITFCLKTFKNVLNNSLSHRGPDDYKQYSDEHVDMQFNRLKVNDLSDNANQPLEYNDCILICNGEIFNHKEIETTYNFNMKSKSDCEVILHLYLYLKNKHDNIYNIIDILCNTLDGEYAFCLYDKVQQFVYFARDPYGVRPLFFDTKRFCFASELKAFIEHDSVQQFPPGHFSILSEFKNMSLIFPYHILCFNKFTYVPMDIILEDVRNILTTAVRKRMMSDRNVCALLSGGLDSSLVAAILAKHSNTRIKTFSIGLKNSPDLHYAKLVAKHINSIHTTIEVEKEIFLGAIEEVIKVIESYDTTTVRASVGNYLVAKYIKENSDCVVVFNGDYADEVCGGYKYFKNSPTDNAFHEECTRLVKDICYFDSLRSDRSISANGLEARVPFADKDFVHYYLSIHPSLRTSNNRIEKDILRKAFEHTGILPDDVLSRKKEAFSYGVSKPEESWSDIITNFVDSKVSDEEFQNNNSLKFKLKETYYYHKVFSKYYKNNNIIPYLWMPKFCDESIVDPSARKL